MWNMVLGVVFQSAVAVEPDFMWPLCGRIAEEAPRGWSPEDGCPADRSEMDDTPLSSTFGPRMAAFPERHYEWHRGIDIPTRCGTPVFAAAGGTVREAGPHPRYEDLMIRVRHGACEDGCWHTEYGHMSVVAVERGEKVEPGQLIGWSGFFGIGKDPDIAASACGSVPRGSSFLHFEVRKAPASDPTSAWARDAIHPMSVLPYTDQGASRIQVSVVGVDTGDPLNPRVAVQTRIPNTGELDVAKVEVRMVDLSTGDVIEQLGAGGGQSAYPVLGTTIDFQAWNHLWSHKNSSAVPWSSFADCPFADAHGANANSDVHLFATHPSDARLGWFNGVGMYAKLMTRNSPDWELTTRYAHLAGPADPADLCVVAWAEDVNGARSAPAIWTEGDAVACGLAVP